MAKGAAVSALRLGHGRDPGRPAHGTRTLARGGLLLGNWRDLAGDPHPGFEIRLCRYPFPYFFHRACRNRGCDRLHDDHEKVPPALDVDRADFRLVGTV